MTVKSGEQNDQNTDTHGVNTKIRMHAPSKEKNASLNPVGVKGKFWTELPSNHKRPRTDTSDGRLWLKQRLLGTRFTEPSGQENTGNREYTEIFNTITNLTVDRCVFSCPYGCAFRSRSKGTGFVNKFFFFYRVSMQLFAKGNKQHGTR